MTALQRQGRSFFLTVLSLAWFAILAAPLFVSAVEPASVGASRGASAPLPLFERVDRNADGYVDAAEARRVPGLADALPRADRNGDRRLDKVEFARALAFIDKAPEAKR